MRPMGERLALAVALVVVAAAAVLPAANATAVASTCEPAKRIIDAPAPSLPAALSAAGHVVTHVSQPDTSSILETLHAPDTTATNIVDGDRQLSRTADVNRRGVVVGTEQYRAETGIYLYQPWVFRNGRVVDLANPGRQGHTVRKDYYALAVNGRSAVVGLKTNSSRYDPTDPEYVVRPMLWPTPRSTPIRLAMPDGYYADASGAFLDILGDGTITGIVRDRPDRNNYLAMWATPTSDPVLQPLPQDWIPTALQGRWVVGRIGLPADKVFVRSWTQAFVVDAPQPLYASAVSGNGTFTVAWSDKTQTPTSYVGTTAGTVHELGTGVQVREVTGNHGGQVLLRRDNTSIEVVTCALALPEASDFLVTPLPLPRNHSLPRLDSNQ